MARIENQPATVPAPLGKIGPTRWSISRLAVTYPRTIVALWSVLSVVGVIAFLNLKLALFPDIAFPVVIVTAQTSEIDPEVNERRVTVPLETRLLTLAGSTRVHSVTYPQYVVVDTAFDVAEGTIARRDEVRAAVARLALPAGTKTTITTLDLNETPVVTYAVHDSGRSLHDLGAFASAVIAPRLRAIAGVLRADVIGAPSVGIRGSIYRLDRKPAVAVTVVKTAGANTLEVADAAGVAIRGIAATHPDIAIDRTSEQSTYIREASAATQEALGIAVILAVAVIWPFLRDLRATMISAVAIPVSLLGTACVMALLHFNLETITLLALALVVGVIVDDAIVAVENIVRHLEGGEPPTEAAYRGNAEIGLTLVAASLTIVAVFLPIGLMRGTLGQFFRAFGITASAAVLFSLLAARTLSPAIAVWVLRSRAPSRPVTRTVDAPMRHDRGTYRRLLGWALVHRATVVGLAVLAFGAGLALIPFIPKGFIPHLDRGEFRVTFTTPIGTSPADVLSVVDSIEGAIAGNNDVTHLYTTIGGQGGRPGTGVIDVHLSLHRHATTAAIEADVRRRLPPLDGVVTTVADVPFVGSDTARALQFALVGDSLDRLRRIGRDFEHRLQRERGFVDVTATGLSDGTAFSSIEHLGGRRAIGISADLVPSLPIGDANDRVSALARNLPRDVGLSFGGSSADALTTFRDFGLALGFSVIAIVAVLVALFRTWIDPLVIIVSLPLSIVGALFALWVTRAEFGLISLMAVIFLFGLVNKNAILLVDRIAKLRGAGLERSAAISEAGAQRLRPIIMTTSATILGMVPIALGFGAGAELRAPMAVAIIGGLITSTILSLIVIPVAYTLVDDLAHRRRTAP